MTTPDWTAAQADAVLAVFDSRTMARAQSYAANGMILETAWQGKTLSGVSRGSGSQRYTCKITTDFTISPPRISASCTCPVAIRCKHCAALALTVTGGSAADTHSGHDAAPPALSRWRTLIEEISSTASPTTPPDGPELPLGLLIATDDYDRGSNAVTIRPLVANEQGRWVKTRLLWKHLLAGTIADRHRADALDALTQLGTLLAVNAPSSTIPDEYSLVTAPSGIWPLLEAARAADVEILSRTSPVRPVVVDDDLTVGLRIAGRDRGVHVNLEVLRDGEPVIAPTRSRPFVLGRPRAHGLISEVDGTIHVGHLDSLTTTESMLLISGVPLEVGDDELTDFQAALPALQSERAVTVEPDAFPSSTLSGPFPILRIAVDGPHPSARWLTGYESDDQTHEYDPQAAITGRFRQAKAEAEMWETVRPELEMVARGSRGWVSSAADRLERQLPTFRADYRRFNRMYAVLRQLRGHCTVPAAFESIPEYRTIPVPLSALEVAILAAETVPKIIEAGRVRVEIDGTPPDYRPAEAPPVLSFAGDASRDWFDLQVSLDVDGHHIPITTVITALAAGETHMLLDDGTYFSLDIAALQTLRDRLQEARELGELDGDRVHTDTLNASLWDELLELGVVDAQLADWRDRMAQLAAAQPPQPVVVPAGLSAELRPYQQEGLDWLSFLWQNRLGGILADDMGLGKTIQTLALFQSIVDEQPDARFLVVAPTSVTANWAAEARRFTPGLVVETASATQKRIGTPLAERVADAHIVITSYALMRIDYEAFAGVAWTGIVFDEAQFLKNHHSKTYQAARRLDGDIKLAITGTPMENRVMELWSLVSVVAPGLYSSPKLFKEHFAEPIESGQAPDRLTVLRRRLRPIMLRRTKDQVLVDLPEKQEQLLPIELEPKHRKIYDTYLARDRQQLLGLLDDFDGNRIQVLRALTRLRQLSLHPGLVDEEHAGVSAAKIEYLSEQLPVLIDEGHSALVFSSFTGFLGLVARMLDAAKIPYSYLDGSTPITKRGEQIERFTDGTTRVFLISLKAGGFGLNLTAADYCFLTDPWWNPAAENQAVDRAHRIGQHRAVSVYRMVSTGTIEEKVVDLQDRKRQLFTALIDEGAAFSGAITADDVRGLLS